MPDQPPVFQVVFRNTDKPGLEKWLRAQGWVLVRLPQDLVGEDDLTTYVVHPVNPSVEVPRHG
jgi:hypothetical protein